MTHDKAQEAAQKLQENVQYVKETVQGAKDKVHQTDAVSSGRIWNAILVVAKTSSWN